jgi:hypothetical protein
VNLRPLVLLLIAAASPDTHYFRYERPILNTPPKQLQTCVALDAATFAHAAPLLADLRLYREGKERPYAIRFAAPTENATQIIAPVNLGDLNGKVAFDAEMPDGHYDDIDLKLDTQNFIATVEVSGSQDRTGRETRLGSYTIFDLTDQKLGRSTVLHIPESDFRFLHFRISGPVKPKEVTGLTIDRLAEDKPQYVTVAESSSIAQRDKGSIVEFTVPGNVPVDRIEFVPGTEPASFSRDVTISVSPVDRRSSAGNDNEFFVPTTASGNLLRVHGLHNGRRIDEEHLAIGAPWSAFRKAAKWTITIDNGSDVPIDLKSVRLLMIKRTLCFDAAPGAGYALYYGDPELSTPRYDYASLFSFERDGAQAALGPEQSNPDYRARPDERPFTEKHPSLLWVALVIVILLLGGIALRSAKQVPQK